MDLLILYMKKMASNVEVYSTQNLIMIVPHNLNILIYI